MPERFRKPFGLPGLPGVALDAIQVSLHRLIRLLDVKTSRGFDLSSAVVPVVDVTHLIENEGNRGALNNEVAIDRAYNAVAVGPHGATERWRYTVPPGKRALLKSGNVWIMRATAPGAVGNAHVNLYVLRGGLPPVVTVTRIVLRSATVGDSRQANAPAGLELLPGDALIGETTDVSTGGTHEIDVSASLVERDG